MLEAIITPESYKWEYKYTSGSCQGNWIVSPWTGDYAGFFESRPGTWDVRLTVTYMPPPMPPHDPTVITQSVTIAPATHFTTIAGLNTPANCTSSIVLKFRVEAATRPCGGGIQMGCVAQEKITNVWAASPPYAEEYPPDGDWAPDTPIDRFKLQFNEIWDTDSNGLTGPLWDQLATPMCFMNFNQSLRLKYVDPCGDTKTIRLGSHGLAWTKVDANNWQVSEL